MWPFRYLFQMVWVVVLDQRFAEREPLRLALKVVGLFRRRRWRVGWCLVWQFGRMGWERPFVMMAFQVILAKERYLRLSQRLFVQANQASDLSGCLPFSG